ncbi:hypothetical protein Taro_048341 [Colocasia esculenta]|uniref:Uncharacterized protein n=1 Tax=Colocasia esculenta TaxID=4460 RepID=A0A843X2J5_COLES|nr:hypothetical protein [Colocasia esculenta]
MVIPRGGRIYRWCCLRRCCVRLVPPAVVLVELCELVLPRGMPQVIMWFIVARFECRGRHSFLGDSNVT